jgi:AraC-like DNA-binding protein
VTDQRDTIGEAIVRTRTMHHHYSGPHGMRTLPNEGRIESLDANLFQADITSIHLGELVLRRTTITPHRAIIDGQQRGEDKEVLRLVVVKDGAVFAAPPGGDPARFDVGDALFAGPTKPCVYQTNGPLESISATLPISRLPAPFRELDALPSGPLPHSPLVDAVVQLLFCLVDRIDEPMAFDAGYAAQGLIDLQLAMITELLKPQAEVPGPERVHEAAIGYIDRHLGDSQLRPPQIADALGVSLRYLHHAFADKDATVARYLRTRRLEQVATTLRTGRPHSSLEGLAVRFGFRSKQQLARSFHRQYDVSMTEYRRSHSKQRPN